MTDVLDDTAFEQEVREDLDEEKSDGSYEAKKRGVKGRRGTKGKRGRKGKKGKRGRKGRKGTKGRRGVKGRKR